MKTKVVAKNKLTNVLVDIPSPNIYQVKIAITIIPDPNPINLPGHNIPSNPATIYFVAIIKTYDIGKPKIDINIGFSLAQHHINCPLT